MATQIRNPTSEVAVTGTWSGTSRHLILDDHPDSGNPAADLTTCSAAGTLVMGFSAFTIPAGSTAISVQVLYYDFKNGSQGSVAGSLIRCNDTTNRNSATTHNPGNGNAAIALRTDNYATNPKSGQAWTVDDVNRVGVNALTAFGVRVTDASPTVSFSSAQVQVTYTPPSTPFAAQLSTPAMGATPQAMTRLNEFAGELTARAVGITAQSLTWTLVTFDFVVELSAASMAVTARAFWRFADWVGTFRATSFGVAARSLTRVNDWSASLSAASVSLTSLALTFTQAVLQQVGTAIRRGLMRVGIHMGV